MSALTDLIQQRYDDADTYLSTKRALWEEVEDLFDGNLEDKLSNTTKSRVFDHKISTYILESEARVMAQIPTGKVKAISRNDELSSKLMNLILDKYIVPNANAQFPLLVKLRILHRLSKIYGSSFYMVDWDVKRNGYVGPDLYLLNIWNIFPQVGAQSLNDSDFIIVRTFRPMSWFEGLKKKDGFKNIDSVIKKLKDLSSDKTNDTEKTQREQNDYPDQEGTKGVGPYEVISMYERDRWVDSVPGCDFEVIRDRENPNKDGELPVGVKYAIPRDDDFMGMGDAERGRSMQYVINSSWNLGLDSAKMSIFPPVVFNKDVIVKSSIKRVAGANWIARGNVDQAARAINLSPQGVQTLQAVYNLANASLLNHFGTTDTSVSSQTDTTFGKTPEALRQQGARENARDSWDRFYVELAITDIFKKMVNLMSNRQQGKVMVRMFDEEVTKLLNQYPELRDQWDEKKGVLKIDKKKTGSVLYDYEIVSGSSYQVDQNKQQENMLLFLELLMKYQPLLQILQQEGTKINFTELITRQIANSGIANWDKIVQTQDTSSPGAQEDDSILQQHQEQFLQEVQKLSGEMGNIPPQPGQVPQDMGQQSGLPVDPMMNGQE